MPHTVRSFQPTPNPNALKCMLEPPLAGPIRSFRRAEEAAGDPLAAAIFEVRGVTGLLMSGDWMTVSKSPEAAWGPIRTGVEQVLAAS